MKRTCNNCRANSSYCDLGYKRESITKYYDNLPLTTYKPLEKCPKPTTIKEYVRLFLNRGHKGYQSKTKE